MKDNSGFVRHVWFILVSGIGGFLLSLTGLSVGWMVGTLLIATFLSFKRPAIIRMSDSQKGIPKYWMYIGQCVLGIELGMKMNLSVFRIFLDHWFTVVIMLVLSVLFALLSGFVLWKLSKMDMLTSFFSAAPGGLSAMPGIAEEVGANTGIVSIIQAMRIFLVVFTIPVVVSLLAVQPVETVNTVPPVSQATAAFGAGPFLWTIVLAFVAWGGYYLGKFLKFPAPWLLGSMVSVAGFQLIGASVFGEEMAAWWPHELIIGSQIFIAASIGSRFQASMFRGLRKTLSVAFFCTIGLILIMVACAYVVSALTGISFITSVLAFAPGGIAEMTTTAVVLHADSTLVVAVQVLRVIAVCVILPPVFKLLHRWERRKHVHPEVSA